MKHIILDYGFNEISYDAFTWADSKRNLNKCELIICIPLNRIDLKQISLFVWNTYREIISEIPTYFEDEYDPFPLNENTILENPILLVDYFLKSRLWADYLIKQMSLIFDWNFKTPKYHVLGIDSFNYIDNTFHLNFRAISI